MTLQYKSGGTWVAGKQVYVKQGGVWVPVRQAHVRSGGVWSRFFAKPVVLTYIGSNSSATDASGYSFASQGIGTAASDRLVIVAACSRATVNIACTGITIGGTAATLNVNLPTGLGSAAIGSLLVPAGTTATIGVNYSTTTRRCGIAVYTLTDYLSATPTDTAAPAQITSGTSITSNLDVKGGGVGLILAGNGVPQGMTWSGGATENLDAAVEAVMQYSVANVQPASDTTNVNYTASWTTADGGWGCGVAFR